MSNTRVQTRNICTEARRVEGVPVLVPAQPGVPTTGTRNWSRAYLSTPTQQPIRELTESDWENAEEILGPDDWHFLQGAQHTSQGFETSDELLRERGFRLMGEAHPEFLAHQDALAGALRLSALISERLDSVRLVMWLAREGIEGKFLPAFYAPDVATGITVKALMDLRNSSALWEVVHSARVEHALLHA